MSRWMVLVGCAMGLAACGPKDYVGDFCAAAESCYQKAGEAFSISQCENAVQAVLEGSKVKGCGGEYESFIGCVEDLSCDQLRLYAEQNQAPQDCGAAANQYNKCMQ